MLNKRLASDSQRCHGPSWHSLQLLSASGNANTVYAVTAVFCPKNK